MILQKTISKENFYNTYFSLLNPIFNLTKLEIDILSEFLKLYKELNGVKDADKMIFSSTSRQLICERLDISKYNLNNYIKSLKKKNMIVDLGDGKYMFNPYLNIDPQDGFEITFKIKIN